jgi:hypothetical protein
MKLLAPIVLSLALMTCVSCGGGGGSGSSKPADFVVSVGQYDELTENFHLKYATKVRPADPIGHIIEGQWLDVQECAGIAAPNTLYRVVITYKASINMELPTALYRPDEHEIDIDDQYIKLPHVLRHEMIHHLLHVTGYPYELNRLHLPEWMFNTCIYTNWRTL